MSRALFSPKTIARIGSAFRKTGTPLRILALIILLILLVQVLMPTKSRVVTVEARTQGMVLEFSGSGQEWQIAGARLCQPDQPAPCPPAPLDVLSWPDGTSAQLIRSPGAGTMVLTILGEGAAGLPKGSRLEFDDAAFRKNGQQTFRGYVTLGAEPGSARRGYLWDAHYRFLERDALALFSGSSGIPIREGALTQGDRVSVVCAKAHGNCKRSEEQSAQPMLVFGHVILELATDEKPGFDVVLTSAKGDVALKVERYGIGDVGDTSAAVRQNSGFSEGWPFSDTSAGASLEIRPTWIDAVLANPTFLALSLILTFLATIIQTSFPASKGDDEVSPAPQTTPQNPGRKRATKRPKR